MAYNYGFPPNQSQSQHPLVPIPNDEQNNEAFASYFAQQPPLQFVQQASYQPPLSNPPRQPQQTRVNFHEQTLQPPTHFDNSSSGLLRRKSTRTMQRSHSTRRRMITGVQNGAPAPWSTATTSQSNGLEKPRNLSAWRIFTYMVTCCLIPPVMRFLGKHDPNVRQAFREKIALCFIIACLCGFVVFITVGMQPLLCPANANPGRVQLKEALKLQGNDRLTWAFGIGYRAIDVMAAFPLLTRDNLSRTPTNDTTSLVRIEDLANADLTPFFQPVNPCNLSDSLFPCLVRKNCLSLSILSTVPNVGELAFDWDTLGNDKDLIVYDGIALDITSLLASTVPLTLWGPDIDNILRTRGGRDMTMALKHLPDDGKTANCLIKTFRIGAIDKQTVGCFASTTITITGLAVVLLVILTRFVMAVTFDWFISRKLSRLVALQKQELKKHGAATETLTAAALRKKRSTKAAKSNSKFLPSTSRYSTTINGLANTSTTSLFKPGSETGSIYDGMTGSEGGDPYVVLLVTCYSENEASLRTTLESLAETDYTDQRKLLFVIADGLVTGSGNPKSTPDLLLDMIEVDSSFADPEPKSYIAIASGAKQLNMAKVYAGDFVSKDHVVPIVLIVKCGTAAEANAPKPGNRGKRDSQLILMSFFQKVLFDDRMTTLDYDLFTKIHYLIGVTPDAFTGVLMVDADTRVAPDSLRLLVTAMELDPQVMGLCGETRIANKTQSWVTMIQCYEYFIAHHLGKGFESVFGGVTCLPGCFCMYRIKAPKNGTWVPIISNPAIIEEYSQNEVVTLHEKNLLLLGEDRFLTTLMLRTFPKRKMIFVPQALCHTVVPDEFRVLLSQRRRWINSTIHNLLELVLVRDLCGTFCFSMQFVVALELLGTVVLPAAMVLTFVLIINLASSPLSDPLPLAMLLTILFSPAVLIVITTRKVVYIGWMFIYLLALPIWNFILPMYAFSKFDDFSWGETRKVAGEVGKDDHGAGGGQMDASQIQMKRWAEWTRFYFEQGAVIGGGGNSNSLGRLSRRQSQGTFQELVQQPMSPTTQQLVTHRQMSDAHYIEM